MTAPNVVVDERNGARIGPRARRGQGRLMMFVPSRSVMPSLSVIGVIAILLYPTYADESLWIGAGLALSLLVFWHALLAARELPWIPGLLAATASLQWILAPWAAYHLPIPPTGFRMELPANEYFSFAVPVTLALALGAYLPLIALGRRPLPARGLVVQAPQAFNPVCELMVGFGLVVRFLITFVPSLRLGYVGALAWQLAYVGALGLVLTQRRGWRWWIGSVLILHALLASAEGMFHDLLLWTTYTLLIIAFRWRSSTRTLVTLALLGAVIVVLLNAVKSTYRDAVKESSLSIPGRAAVLVGTIADQLREPGLMLSEDYWAANVGRLNQGGIISRILVWVPEAEPLAGGETVRLAVRAALLPRVLDPDKIRAGGHENFARFTGHQLQPGTSMNLSVAGEMYANFGRRGGIIGVFAFGLMVGLIYRQFVKLSRRSILWWAWAPYVLFWTVQAENGLSESLNQVTKSALVMIAVTMTVPGWTVLRRWHLAVKRGRRGPTLVRRQTPELAPPTEATR